jgi:FkbM family methyltransferase
MQGKSFGAFTTASEANAIIPLLPKKGAIVLDVGANQGLWTKALLASAEDQIERIYAFEPSRANHEALSQIDWPGLEVVHAAVGRAPGTVTIYSDYAGSGLASVHPRHDVTQTMQEQVPMVSLDDFVYGRGLERIDFLKMDIEGHELFALEGAARLLSERRVRALSFEFGDSNLNSRTFFRDFWEKLTGYGFSLFRITPGAKLYPITRYWSDLEEFVGVANYVAVLRGDDSASS